jgi:hypothetical protein
MYDEWCGASDAHVRVTSFRVVVPERTATQQVKSSNDRVLNFVPFNFFSSSIERVSRRLRRIVVDAATAAVVVVKRSC